MSDNQKKLNQQLLNVVLSDKDKSANKVEQEEQIKKQCQKAKAQTQKSGGFLNRILERFGR